MSDDSREHWLEKYNGQQVVVQLRGVHYSVTTVRDGGGAGTFIPVKDDDGNVIGIHNMPTLLGTMKVERDDYENLRVVIRTPDPNQKEFSGNFINVDLPEELIEVVNVVEEASRIATP